MRYVSGNRKSGLKTAYACLCLLILLIPFTALAQNVGPQRINLQGRIVRPDGTALDSASVSFTLQIRSPAPESCVLFEENHVLNMSATDGIFSIRVGSGARSGVGTAGTLQLKDAFNNSSSAITGVTCSTLNSYTPTAADVRTLRVTFDEGGGPQTLAQDQVIQSVPFAMYADRLQGKAASDFVQSVPALEATPGTSQSRVNRLIDTDWAGLDALLNGTSTLYAKAAPTAAVSNNNQRLINVADPTGAQDAATKNYTDTTIGGYTATVGVLVPADAGKAITWDGTKWVASTVSTTDATKVAKAGDTMTGTLNLPANGLVAGTNQLVLSGGKVAIGHTSPVLALDVETTTTLNGVRASYNGVSSTSSGAWFKAQTGTDPTAADHRLGVYAFGGGLNDTASITGFSGDAWSGTSRSSYLTFATTPIGSVNRLERMRIGTNGNVGIGTTTPLGILHATGVSTATSAGYQYGSISSLTATPAAPSSVTAYIGASNKVSTASSDVTSTLEATESQARVTGGTTTLTNATGVLGGAVNLAARTVTTASGGDFFVLQNNASGTITDAMVVKSSLTRTAGTVTNGYGLYVGNIEATNPWSIYASSTAPSYFGGSVGIGTASPAYTLDVSGTINSSGVVRANRFTAATTSSGFITDGITLLNPHTGASGPGSKLVFDTGASLTRANIIGGASGTNQGYLAFETRGTSPTTNVHERMRIDENGYVGIGVTAPARLLHVAGPMRLAPAALPGTPAAGDLAIDSADSNSLKYYDGSAWVKPAAGGGGGVTIGQAAGNAMGADAVPNCTASQKLQMSLGPTFAWSCVTDASTPGGATTQVQFNNAGAFAGSTDFVWDNTNKRLGIRTATPAEPLSVDPGATGGIIGGRAYMGGWSGGSVEAAFAHYHFLSSNTHYAMRQSESGRTIVNAGAGSELQFAIDNTERMRVHTDGNIGIGTSTPTEKLHVAGNILSTGRIVASVGANANALSAITADFASTNMVRAGAAAAACGTLNFTNVAAGGTYTVTIPNATTTCSTIQLSGATTNVKLPLGYTAGSGTAGVVYTAIYDGTTLWVSVVPF